MSAPKTNPPKQHGFAGLPIITDWNKLYTDAVIFGVPFGKPYHPMNFPNNQSEAPDAIRKAFSRIVLDHHVVDTDIADFNSINSFSIADGGDIPLKNNNIHDHYEAAEEAVRFAIERGIIPVSIGGDDGVTNPVLRGLNNLSDITLIQIDAHLDWRDERNDERDGYSSPMRRASELPHISSIHQIGIRSFGSAKKSDLHDAKAWGSKIHLARDIQKLGVGPIINELPSSGRFFITLDIDGLDPSVMPGTIALAPGGLTWWHIVELFEGLVNKGNVIGLNLVELAPKNDINQISLIGAGRLIIKLLMLQLRKHKHK